MNSGRNRYNWTLPLAGIALCASLNACYAPPVQQADARSEPTPADLRDKPAEGAKESVRAPVRPTPVETRTPEEAAKRAADPKDPSGALIVEPKSGVK